MPISGPLEVTAKKGKAYILKDLETGELLTVHPDFIIVHEMRKEPDQMLPQATALGDGNESDDSLVTLDPDAGTAPLQTSESETGSALGPAVAAEPDSAAAKNSYPVPSRVQPPRECKR